MTTDEDATAVKWWGQRRGRFNVVLIVAGIAAFALYAVVVENRGATCVDFEITLLIFPQAAGYLVVANVLYNLGRWSEEEQRPKDVGEHRRRMFRAGLAIAVVVPFVLPLAALLARCSSN